MKPNLSAMEWTRAPKQYEITEDSITVVTEPFTDLWQRTYYHFRNDNAPVLQLSTDEKYFSFVVKTDFASKRRFDQSGIVMYLDSDNWLKAALSTKTIVFSGWAASSPTTAIPTGPRSMWTPRSNLPGSASAAGRTISVWSIPTTA